MSGPAVHELTINGVKCGARELADAMPSPRRIVDVFNGGARTLDLTWTERGMPAVLLNLPGRFCGELIGQALPYRPGMEARLEFRGAGVRRTISVPLSDKAASAQAWEAPS